MRNLIEEARICHGEHTTHGKFIQELADHAEEAEAYAAELEKERDHWKDVAGREGVCMACRGPRGSFDPYGCTDCLNTGYCGEHHSTVAELEAKLAKAVEFAEIVEKCGNGPLWDLARATLAELKGPPQ